ncbi:MAG: ParB/RepB/Spo0J family partition protein [Desmonostoc geniculatum HA4340-LM1]|jgi:ParB family chromosome partitioning protein|nr:ParB/RepB/Spo0J family partition protein [Desmonostoc geniculatum HA4340-LM1]
MVTRKAPDLTNYFSAAKQSQQLSEAESEIQRLKAEIEELRSKGSTELEEQLQTLRSQLQSQSGIQSIPLEQIQANPEQPRQTFLAESIESMSRSLTSDGQLEPIILIQRENLVIFDGERRWRSAKTLGWQNLQAVIIPEPAALHRKALLTSLHREDLNPLDKAEAIVRELASNAGLEAEDIPRILSTVVRRLNAQKRMNSVVELMTGTPEEQEQGLADMDLDEPEQAVLALLLDLQLNPASIDANIFPMLSLAEDLKAAIRSRGLKGVHAMALQKLSAKNLGLSESEAQAIRSNTTQQAIFQKLSVQATRKLVAEVIASQSQASPTPQKPRLPVATATRSLHKISGEALKKAEVSQLMEFQEALRQKLAEIELVLKQKAINATELSHHQEVEQPE